MLELRIRACHLHGTFRTRGQPQADILAQQRRDREPRTRYDRRSSCRRSTYAHEKSRRSSSAGPRRSKFITRARTERGVRRRRWTISASSCSGRPVQHRLTARSSCSVSLGRLRQRTQRAESYVLNVTYPLVDDEFVGFLRRQESRADGRGGPARLHRAGAVHGDPAPADLQTRVYGKDVLPMAGEYTGDVMQRPVSREVPEAVRARTTSLPAARAGVRPILRGRQARRVGASSHGVRYRCVRRASAPAARSGRSSRP